MASFMPSASDKKRLSGENKQQLTSHTQHEEQQEEQTPALRSALSHGSAPNPEARPPAHTFGCALFYGSNKSWNVTDQRIFLSSSMLSFLTKTEAWSRKVIYLRTFCYQKDREGMTFTSSWLPEPNLKHVNIHFSNRHICVHVIILDYTYSNIHVILWFWDYKANLITVSKTESWLNYYIVCVLVQRHTSMRLYSLHFSFPIDKLKMIIVLWKFGKRWTR